MADLVGSAVRRAGYRYLLDTDGFTSAYKLQQLLAVNSVVLHHRSIWRAYFFDALHAFVHYVPLWQSSSDDVLRLVDWLREHDGVARRIALNGQVRRLPTTRHVDSNSPMSHPLHILSPAPSLVPAFRM